MLTGSLSHIEKLLDSVNPRASLASGIRTAALSRPRVRHRPRLRRVVDDEDQLVIVVAIEDLDVDAGVRHPAADLAELTWLGLVEPLDDNVSLRQNRDSGILERAPGGGSVLEEEVGHATALDDERAAALDADTGAAERVAHIGERARAIVEKDREIFHCHLVMSGQDTRLEVHPGPRRYVWPQDRIVRGRCYSLASASTGSIFVTRRAGRKLAVTLASARVMTTPANTAWSRGSTL